MKVQLITVNSINKVIAAPFIERYIECGAKLPENIREFTPTESLEFYTWNSNGEIFIDASKKDKRLNKSKIIELKQKLANTDYLAIKFAEGIIPENEFAPIREDRKMWRNEINILRQ